MRAVLSPHLTTALLWLSATTRPFRRTVRLPPGVVKVNIGSGLAVAPGWVNLDASLNAFAAHMPRAVQRLAHRASGSRLQFSREQYIEILRANRFVFRDVRHGLPFPSESVDYLYASHVLEHLEREEAVALVSDARRVLKPGGVFRIVVPDLAYFVALYGEGRGDEAVTAIFSAGVSGSLGRHRYMYDEEGLRRLIGEAGFHRMTRCEFRQGAMVDADLLDSRPDESLFVEVIKGEGGDRGGDARWADRPASEL
jgi:predicted SAM-dependent methyltransferase